MENGTQAVEGGVGNVQGSRDSSVYNKESRLIRDVKRKYISKKIKKYVHAKQK